MARLEQRDLGRLRLLDLDDHVAAGEHRRRVRDDRRADILVILVLEIDAETGTGLDDHRVPGGGQFGHRGRGQADPIFVVLDFLGNTDAHRQSPQNARLRS